jgi:hypothetical protein
MFIYKIFEVVIITRKTKGQDDCWSYPFYYLLSSCKFPVRCDNEKLAVPGLARY